MTDHGAKDSCNVSLHMHLQIQSMSKMNKKCKNEEDLEDNDRHCKK
jgi:hypothetical protein